MTDNVPTGMLPSLFESMGPLASSCAQAIRSDIDLRRCAERHLRVTSGAVVKAQSAIRGSRIGLLAAAVMHLRRFGLRDHFIDADHEGVLDCSLRCGWKGSPLARSNRHSASCHRRPASCGPHTFLKPPRSTKPTGVSSPAPPRGLQRGLLGLSPPLKRSCPLVPRFFALITLPLQHKGERGETAVGMREGCKGCLLSQRGSCRLEMSCRTLLVDRHAACPNKSRPQWYHS